MKFLPWSVIRRRQLEQNMNIKLEEQPTKQVYFEKLTLDKWGRNGKGTGKLAEVARQY